MIRPMSKLATSGAGERLQLLGLVVVLGCLFVLIGPGWTLLVGVGLIVVGTLVEFWALLRVWIARQRQMGGE